MGVGKFGKGMPALTETFVPSAAVTAWRFVDVAGLNIATQGARAFGISAPFDSTTSTDATNKKPVAVISLGVAVLEVNATVSTGDKLMSDSVGRGIKWVPGANNFKSAIAREGGNAGDRIAVFVLPQDDQNAGLTPGSGAVLAIASNAIAPTNLQHHLGAGLLKTITVPAGGLADGTVLTIIPDAAYTYDATGNINLPTGGGTAVINKPMFFVWDGVNSKWDPSY